MIMVNPTATGPRFRLARPTRVAPNGKLDLKWVLSRSSSGGSLCRTRHEADEADEADEAAKTAKAERVPHRCSLVLDGRVGRDPSPPLI